MYKLIFSSGGSSTSFDQNITIIEEEKKDQAKRLWGLQEWVAMLLAPYYH